jgi:dihydroneopterin aldolase
VNSSILSIRQLAFHGHCGTTAQERDIGQRLTVDVECACDTTAAASSDRLSDTLDYDHLCDEILKIGRESRVCLVETLAERIAEKTLEDARVLSVTVRITKPSRPEIRGGFVVELLRSCGGRCASLTEPLP